MQQLTSEQLLKLLQELPEWKELNKKVKTLEKEVKELQFPPVVQTLSAINSTK